MHETDEFLMELCGNKVDILLWIYYMRSFFAFPHSRLIDSITNAGFKQY